MSEKSNSTNWITTLCSTIVFITLLVLKTTKTWDISWWWVFSPFWGPLAVVLVIGLIYVTYNLAKHHNNRYIPL